MVTSQEESIGLRRERTSRVLPEQKATREHAVPLSLLDATTANFGLTSAIWLFERPTTPETSEHLAEHLRTALGQTLNAYPQLCGHLKAILSLDGADLPSETTSFPVHAKRYGRVYGHYGTASDPGIELIEAKSTTSVDNLCDANSAKRRPVWRRQGDEETLTRFVPSTEIVSALEPDSKDGNGLHKPIMAVQYTGLGCGGFVLAAKIAHPLADITALTRFVRDWAGTSRSMLTDNPIPVLNCIFEPALLDASAAGDINAADADPHIMEDALSLPLHRYDWWAPPSKPPAPFPMDLPLAGKPLPWSEWNTKVPIERCTIHFSREQIDQLWQKAIDGLSLESSSLKISKHDALLAHIWSCVVRARDLQDDQGPVHCDLVLGTRPAFGLDEAFIGSPTMMLNIEMSASDVSSSRALGQVARRIRETVSTVNDPKRLASHLHTIAFEKSPQRIWQGFLGQRHIMVTTWARAGIYDVDFGFGSQIRYADGVVPCLDGCILIVDGPPTEPTSNFTPEKQGWTQNGVEVTFPLRSEDIDRLLNDSLLLP